MKELYEALKEMIVVAENRMPAMPTVEEIEALRRARAALEKAGGKI